MAYDLEEQEKIDQLKAWWGSYGTAALTFLVVLLVLVAGWRGWQWYQGHQANQARGYFEALEDASRQTGDESVARINAAVTTLRSVRQNVASLSGGQRQSVAVAKAVMWNSKLVILDEPTAALGVAQTHQVLELVRRLADRGTVYLLERSEVW